MTILAVILGSIVFAYTIAYGVKRFIPILQYSKKKRSAEIKFTTGKIVEKIEEENKAFQGEMINICYPKYEYELNGKTQYYQSTVHYRNAIIGYSTEIGYCERTGEAWVIKDIPVMKKNLIMKISILIVILIVLIASEVLL